MINKFIKIFFTSVLIFQYCLTVRSTNDISDSSVAMKSFFETLISSPAVDKREDKKHNGIISEIKNNPKKFIALLSILFITAGSVTYKVLSNNISHYNIPKAPPIEHFKAPAAKILPKVSKNFSQLIYEAANKKYNEFYKYYPSLREGFIINKEICKAQAAALKIPYDDEGLFDYQVYFKIMGIKAMPNEGKSSTNVLNELEAIEDAIRERHKNAAFEAFKKDPKAYAIHYVKQKILDGYPLHYSSVSILNDKTEFKKLISNMIPNIDYSRLTLEEYKDIIKECIPQVKAQAQEQIIRYARAYRRQYFRNKGADTFTETEIDTLNKQIRDNVIQNAKDTGFTEEETKNILDFS